MLLQKIMCFVMVLFQFGFFARPPQNPHPDPNRKAAINAVKEFPLTMTPSEVSAKAEALGLTIIDPWDDPYYDPSCFSLSDEKLILAKKEGRLYNVTWSFYLRYEEGIEFYFTADEKLNNIRITSDLFETPEGVRVGNSKRNTLRVYGLFGSSISPMVYRKTKDGYYGLVFDFLKINKTLTEWNFFREFYYDEP